MRLIARFAQEKNNYFEVVTVYDERTIKERLNKTTPALISIAKDFPAAVWFERKITDDFGIEILYGNDKRPLTKHEHFPKDVFPMRKNYVKFSVKMEQKKENTASDHGVIIGPTHPYHLESSQFQLFDRNHKILHFEVMPFYKYRGIEKMVEGLTLDEARPIVERISGRQSIAYQIAYLEIKLTASTKILPSVIKERHLFLLEFERIINHLTDLSILCQLLKCNDGAIFLMNLLEAIKQAMFRLTGHRFGFSAVSVENNLTNIEETIDFLFNLEKDLLWFDKWSKKQKKLLQKIENIGTISQKTIESYGLVGIVARSNRKKIDRRLNNKCYEKKSFYINLEEEGDVLSRFNIRLSEIFTSFRIMKNLIKLEVYPFPLGIPADGEYYSYVESYSGEVMMYLALKDGLIERFFVRDPSFLNAQALSSSMKNNNIENLGLIIQSIPLDFSSNDM